MPLSSDLLVFIFVKGFFLLPLSFPCGVLIVSKAVFFHATVFEFVGANFVQGIFSMPLSSRSMAFFCKTGFFHAASFVFSTWYFP